MSRFSHFFKVPNVSLVFAMLVASMVFGIIGLVMDLGKKPSPPARDTAFEATYTQSPPEKPANINNQQNPSNDRPKPRVEMIYPLPKYPVDKGLIRASGIIEQTPYYLFLDSTFEANAERPGFDNSSIITFLPGQINGNLGNSRFYFDEELVYDPVYAIPQWPQVFCDASITTKEACLAAKADQIPPVIFFFRTYVEGDSYRKFEIRAGEGDSETQPTIYKTSINTYGTEYADYLLAAENCNRGYYYDPKYISTPPPDNNIIGYKLIFPPNRNTPGDLSKTVYIKFDKDLYDLVIPPGSLLKNYTKTHPRTEPYEVGTGFSVPGEYYSVEPYSGIYLPLDMLYFSDGSKATTTESEYIYPGDYFEYLPINRHTLEELPEVYTRETIGSSSCDG